MIRVPWLNLGQALAVAGAANWPRCFRSTRPPSGKVVRQQFACVASAACTSSLIDGPCQDLVCGPCGLHMTVATLLSPNWEVRQPTRSSGIFSSLVLFGTSHHVATAPGLCRSLEHHRVAWPLPLSSGFIATRMGVASTVWTALLVRL